MFTIVIILVFSIKKDLFFVNISVNQNDCEKVTLEINLTCYKRRKQ